MALQELVNETPINAVAAKYKCARGMLQSLQQMASTFAGIVTSFCNSLQWDTLSLIVSQFKERLYFGVHRDLIDLMRIPDLNHKRARALFDAGITSLVDLANADILSIEKILYNALSFDSAKQHDNENVLETAQRNEARNFYITGKAGITVAEAAKLLVQEARCFVQYEIGVGNINWSQNKDNTVDINAGNNDELHMSYEEKRIPSPMENDSNETEVIVTIKDKDKNTKECEYIHDNYNAKHNKGDVPTATSKTIKTRDTENLKEATKVKVDDPQNVIETKNSLKDDKNKNYLNGKEKDNILNEFHTKSNDLKKGCDRKEAKDSGQEKRAGHMKQIVKNHNINNIEDNGNVAIVGEERIDAHASKTDNDIKKAIEKPKSSEQNADKQELTPINVIRSNDKENTNLKSDVNNKKTTEKRKSTEETAQNKDVTSPKLRRSNENSNERPINDEEKPSTSKKAQRLLRAKQLSEMKKQEWAKKQVNQEKLSSTPSSEMHKQNGTTISKNEQEYNIESSKIKQNPTTSSDYKNRNNPNSNNHDKDFAIKAQNETPKSNKDNIMNEKSTSVQNALADKKQNEFVQPSHNTPRSSLKTYNNKATTKMPRRSPRNHLISSTRIEQKSYSTEATTPPTKKSISKATAKSPQELFGDDNEESFVFNTGVNEALKKAECSKATDSKEDDFNKSQDDEIPSSQKMVEDITTNKTNSPHASRFLRSLRATQRLNTPKSTPRRATREPKSETTKVNHHKSSPIKKSISPEIKKTPPQEPPSSSSIELSDFSMENSLMKNPMHLNASHIMSCSKVDTESSSFKSIDIIDICGDQQLFKGAFKEFMANKRLGFCLGVQQQPGKRKPIIGANLLLNQVATAEKDSESTQKEFQIDDTNYLAGIGFCISDSLQSNLVYYMNMQTEGTCKGLTAEVKCKYLRMLFRSSDHCLIVYDAKEQFKIIRKLMKDIGEISISLEDPKVANWLLQPDKTHNLHSLVIWV